MILSHIKKYDTPFFKTLWPLFAGAGITAYLFAGVSRSMSQLPEYVNDPQNPYKTKKH